MADEDKKPDEYQYPPEEYYKGGEYIPPDDSQEPSGPGRGPSLLPRRYLVILGVVAAVVVVYLILLYTNYKRNAALNQTTETATATIPTTPNPPAAPVQQVTPPTQVAVPETSDMQRLAQQNQANQQALSDLQNQMAQLQSQLSTLTNSISTINNQIQVIANEVRGIAAERGLGGRNISLTTTGTAYHLKALVPGRAWVQSAHGALTSVTIGDRLPGYGIIQMINIAQGIVTTSSGAIIQYGQRDS